MREQCGLNNPAHVVPNKDVLFKVVDSVVIHNQICLEGTFYKRSQGHNVAYENTFTVQGAGKATPRQGDRVYFVREDGKIEIVRCATP